MWVRVLLVGASLAGALAACAVVDPVDNRYDTISRSLAKARNEAIFLNLVRASHDYPLSFVTIANVTPSLTNTTSLALPSFLLGPHIAPYATGGATVTAPLFTPGRDVIFGNTTAGNTTAVSTNFNVSTQETSAFYEGFLKPIDLTTLNYFIRQGYPRELLFWLFTDSLQVQLGDDVYGYHYSPPDDYGCPQNDKQHRCFIDWIHNAAFIGLTVEEKTLQKSGGAGGASAGKTESGGAAGAKPTTYAYSRFCFNQVLGEEAKATVSKETSTAALQLLPANPKLIKSSGLVCGDPSWQPSPDDPTYAKAQPDILPLDLSQPQQGVGGRFTLTIVPRSAYGVFEFLGTVMKMRRQNMQPSPSAYIPPGRSDVIRPPFLETVHEDPYVMKVVSNLGGDCFVHTWFEDGEYCVPDEASTTKRIFGLLAQLIAIQTAATDLSITPVVRILQ